MNHFGQEAGAVAPAWETVCRKLTGKIGEYAVERWFSGAQLVFTSETSATLILPNLIHLLWIESNFLPALQQSIQETAQLDIQLKLEIAPDIEAVPAAPLESAAKKFTPRRPSLQERIETAGLTLRHSFEHYVIGPSNRYSALAAQAVAKKPGEVYNPFFLHGPTSTGKTHLIQAIGQYIIEHQPDKNVLYLTAEEFTNEFLDCLRMGRVRDFRNRYRTVDVLLLDDVQFFIGKDSTSEEFFHTFNVLSNARKQIILSSELSPSQLKMDTRMRARFECGLTADLQAPDFETRLGILRQKNIEGACQVPDDLIQVLAQRIHSNVRRLEGALLRLASHISLSGSIPQPDDLGHLLRETFAQEADNSVGVHAIMRRVAEIYDVRLQEILGKRRVKQVAFARQVAMWLTRELTGQTYEQIGDAFGGRDHTTVVHAVKVISTKLQSDSAFRSEMEHMQGLLKA